MRHKTSTARSGSQMPFGSPPGRELDARSMGTSKMTLAGNAKARKTGRMMYPGVVRKTRNRRSKRRTSVEMTINDMATNMPDPTGAGDVKFIMSLSLFIRA